MNNDFAGLYEPTPVHRQPATLAASIWAPQPQPSETTWPRTLDSFSRVAEQRELVSTNIMYEANAAPVRREDVFGPVPTQVKVPRDPTSIGAIGDGRKKSPPEFHDNTHVEQLLRTLNLNSPVPSKKPSLSLSLDASPSSPDFSPASVTSSLMTPTDLSPSQRSFDVNAKSAAYDLGPTAFLQQPSLLFEHPSPAGRTQALESYISQPHMNPFNGSSVGHGAMYNLLQPAPAGYAAVQPQHVSIPSGGLPFFESFAETPAAPALASGLYSSSQTQPQASIHVQVQGQTSPASQLPVQSQSMPQLPTTQTQTHTQPQPQSALAHPPGLLPRGLFNTNTPVAPRHVSGTRLPMDWRLHPQSQGGEWGLGSGAAVGGREDKFDIYGLGHGQGTVTGRSGIPINSRWEAVGRVDMETDTDMDMGIMLILDRNMRMRGRVVELATNCYGCHVLQKALDCEEDIRLLIVSELLLGDPAQTLVNKHASHVWSKIMELSWTPPAPPIFAYVNKSLKGKWASLACHETGSLVVQHAFENLEPEAKDGIVDELINNGPTVFAEVAKNQWGSYCIQHILEHGSDKHRAQTLQHLLDGLLDFATSEQGAKSVTKALKEGGKPTLDRIVERMCEAANG
ncbi:hypothetical protein C0992_006325, partial [Termitomyces sp. T32_za158]